MRIFLLLLGITINLCFIIIVLFVTHSILHIPLLQVFTQHTSFGIAKNKTPRYQHPIAALVESYAANTNFEQIVEETQIIPIPTSSVTPSAAETASYPNTSFADTYKKAGSKFGIPWQILYGIHMTETGCRNGPIFNHSGSGAQGPMQFKPATWRVYGVDGDGDGVADINNAVDAIYSAANFLARHGSIRAGLQAYGGNNAGVLAIARANGFTQ